MLSRLLGVLLAVALVGPALAQTKQRIEKAADLPRFTYKVDGQVEDLMRDDAKFRAFAVEVRRDVESSLAKYERHLLGRIWQRYIPACSQIAGQY